MDAAQEFEIIAPTPIILKVLGKQFVFLPPAIGPWKQMMPIAERAEAAAAAADQIAAVDALIELLCLLLKERGKDGQLQPVEPAWLEENMTCAMLQDLAERVREMVTRPGGAKTPPGRAPASGGASRSISSKPSTAGPASTSSKPSRPIRRNSGQSASGAGSGAI
jgi:hypothetical protein